MKTNINKAIEEWIGVDIELKECGICNSCESVMQCEYVSQNLAINQSLADLRSRIPELEEKIKAEYKNIFDNIIHDNEGCREIDGKDFILPHQLKRVRDILFEELTSKE